ncbi:putative nuclease HARBI1 [Pectinophora gossypiella]|uniref:DDE Tnp4 domain-containing protein n=1 Tax=Pectinophora gossypiella TaxID=13191 RepID=A0A1E1WP29_PECGO|nr:putative nuclease HARBI1 [Pectinophora gossypiella]XP_049865507.1 putative nuclease HARBI1 [Pectinophora gossypiella]XP_049868826.1 putative nuclease HARBI1 [Pectinophora gossypiella]XP_049880779.1 putative nuclease HARBI1 [Pectinophora gossypiella]XP_049887119.1 putative nuclease HARBI1 [Pectinophora gossypiella]
MSDSDLYSDFEEFMDYVYDNPYDYPARKYIRDAQNPLECYDEEQFQKRFRFRKDTVVHMILPLIGLQSNVTNKGLPLPPILQLLIALRFYATGNFQIVCGDLHKISQPVVSKIVAKLSKILAMKVVEFIKFPGAHERANVKRAFYQRAQFPGVIGCIDCTHVPIKNPSRENGELFRNRKGEFSINVQLICGPQMLIYDIVARWPGSAHDSRIFSNSRCSMRFEEGDLVGAGILLGDSGYAQSSYTYTPVLNPQTPAQERYNRSHISTRNIIERLNGVLKRRFACLSRKLQNKIKNVPNIIVACAVLHNISVNTNQEMPEPLRSRIDPPTPVPDNERGSIIRASFIARHFS